MTFDDLMRIEAALGITLPESYKRLVVPFPVPSLRGNSDTDLWDDPKLLMARNQELRTEFVRGHQPWPTHWFFIGDPLSASGTAIDLRDPAASVVWVDHCDLSSVEHAHGEPFVDWQQRWAATVRIELEKDGIDPDGDPEPLGEPWPRRLRILILGGLVLLMGGCALSGFVLLGLKLVRWLVGS